MNDDVKIWLPPMLTLLGTLTVVTFTAWLNTRAVLAAIENKMSQLKLELKLDLQRVENKVDLMV